MKPLIVGEAPSKNEVTERPIEGRIGRRLAALAGLTLEEFLAHFDRVNLLHERQDTAEHGFQFDRFAATKAARELGMTFQHDQVILLLGKRVADAFGMVDIKHFESRSFYSICGTIFVMPHPSGVNRWWNKLCNKREAETFMRTIIERTR